MSTIKKIRNSVGTFKDGVKDVFESANWVNRPQELNIEITSICDSKCIHCPREAMDRRMKAMDFDLFKKVVDEAAEMQIPALCPNGYGEISTVKDMEKYLNYITDREHKFDMLINTNGYRMNEDVQELYIKHKVGMLNICIDGATPETAEKVRVNLKLDQIEKNIHNLMRLRKERGLDYPKIRAGFVVIPENEHEVEMFVEKWKDVVDFVGVDGYSNRAGSLDEKYGKIDVDANKNRTCILPFKTINVWANGEVVICCNDWNSELVVGDLSKQSLKEVWHGEEFAKVRRAHIAGKGDQVSVCANCNYWQEPTWGARLKAG